MPAIQASLAVAIFVALQSTDCFVELGPDGPVSDPKEPILISYLVVAVFLLVLGVRGRLGFEVTRASATVSSLLALVVIVMGLLAVWHHCPCYLDTAASRPWFGGMIDAANNAQWIADFGLARDSLGDLCSDKK